MSARLFRDGIAQLLISDSIFAAAVAALIGQTVTTVLTANTPVNEIPAGQWPCFVIEQGDGQATAIAQDSSDFLTIGNSEQHFESDLDVVLVWKQQDREAAADVRSDLSLLFAQLLLRNSQPGGIFSAWLQSWTTDQGGQHPTHVFAALIRGQYIINRS